MKAGKFAFFFHTLLSATMTASQLVFLIVKSYLKYKTTLGHASPYVLPSLPMESKEKKAEIHFVLFFTMNCLSTALRITVLAFL